MTPHGGKGNASEHGTVAKLGVGSNPSQGRSRCAVDENTNEEKLAAETACILLYETVADVPES